MIEQFEDVDRVRGEKLDGLVAPPFADGEFQNAACQGQTKRSRGDAAWAIIGPNPGAELVKRADFGAEGGSYAATLVENHTVLAAEDSIIKIGVAVEKWLTGGVIERGPARDVGAAIGQIQDDLVGRQAGEFETAIQNEIGRDILAAESGG